MGNVLTILEPTFISLFCHFTTLKVWIFISHFCKVSGSTSVESLEIFNRKLYFKIKKSNDTTVPMITS